MKKRAYDLAFPIGIACSSSETLRGAGLQFLSFPGDWTSPLIAPLPASNLIVRIDWLCRGFDDFFNADDFIFRSRNNETGKDVYGNMRTRYIFNHDFTAGSDLATEIPKVAAKYTRRRNRLLELIRGARRVLVFRLDFPTGADPTSVEDCRHAHRRLLETFPGVEFDFVLMQPDRTHTLETRLVEQLEPWLFRIAFDYRDPKKPDDLLYPNLKSTSAALAAFATVRDYRTHEEKRKHDRLHREKRYQKFGAKSWLDYQRIRLAKGFAKLFGRA